MDMIETNPLVIVLAGALTQGLTWAASRWMPQESRVRTAIPALATCIALGLVTAWQAIQGADAMSWQTVWNGLLAGAAAVLMHSQGSQMLKAAKKAKALDTTAKLGLVLLVALLLPGCGGSGPVTVGDLLPNVHATRDAQGCLALEVEQPVPVEGWEVTNTVKVRQEPGASGDCRGQATAPSEDPQPY